MKRSNVFIVMLLVFAACKHKDPTMDKPKEEIIAVDSGFLLGKWKITLKRTVDVYRDSKGYYREFLLSEEVFPDSVIVEFLKDGRLNVNQEIVGKWKLKDENYMHLGAETKDMNQPLLLNTDVFYKKKRTYMNIVCKVHNSLDHEYRITYIFVPESRW
jgi:hypothetical protein